MVVDVNTPKQPVIKTSPYFKSTTAKNASEAVKRKKPLASNLTSFEIEILELKLKYPNELILVEFGYNHKFYCEDGQIASKILGYKFSAGRTSFYQEENKIRKNHTNKKITQRFAFCSLNSKSLNSCLIKLIKQNHKVLLYKQTIDSQSGEVVRFIETAVSLTTFNYINETISDELYGNNSLSKIENTTILSIYFTYSNQILKTIKFLGFDLKHCKVTHAILINEDNLDENYMKARFLDTVLKFQTIEIVTNVETSDSLIKTLYEIDMKIKVYKQHMIMNASETFPEEYQLLCQYLKQYNLDHSLKTNYNNRKYINDNISCTVSNHIIRHLNFFSNQVTSKVTSTLWGLLNNENILTNYGKDMLVNWIKEPLTSIEEIKLRNETITFLGKDRHIPILLNAIKKFMENKNFKNFARINNKIKLNPQCSIDRKDTYFYLSALNNLRNIFLSHEEYISQIKRNNGTNEYSRKTPALLKKLFIECDALLKDISIHKMLAFIDQDAVFSKDLEKSVINFFKLTNYDHSENISRIEKEISLIEEKKKAQLEIFKTITGKPYLGFYEDGFNIIIRSAEARGLPTDWVFLDYTYKKTAFRRNIYKTPETHVLFEEYEAKQIELLKVCNAEYKYFLERLTTDYDKVCKIVNILASIDCLRCIGLSTRHFITTPIFTTEPGIITLEDAYNPMLDFNKNYLTNNKLSQNIPNNVKLKSDKIFILTGPNAGGKTTIMKKIAYLCILAQIGCNTPCLFHKQSIITLFDIRTGSSDSILQNKSTFLNEMLEYKEMSEKSMSEQSLVLLDEIGRGTSHKDGASLTYAFLKDLKDRGKQKGIVMFITHYHDILKIPLEFSKDEIYKMGYYTVNGSDHSVSIPTFKLEQGIGNSLGVEIAKICGFDDDVVESIEYYKEILESNEINKKVNKINETKDIDALKSLLDNI